MTFLKLVISVGDGHSYCLPHASKNPSYATDHHHCCQHLHHTRHLYFQFFNLITITVIIHTIIFDDYLSHITFIYIHSKCGPSHYAFILCYHYKLLHTMTKNCGDTYRELCHKSQKPLATCINVAHLRELTLQTKLLHESNDK